MMNNLFSVFDPSTSLFSANWMILFTILMLPSMVILNSNFMKIYKMTMISFFKEIKASMNNIMKKEILSFMGSLFLFLLVLNLFALLPFVFSSTAHIMINFPLALTIWFGLMLMGWLKNFKHMLIHLVPVGTPSFLLPLMVSIELISNLIRPITLSVRLTANMVAGHLLMNLLGNFLLSSKYVLFTNFWIMILLTFLETAVAFIQAYVFMTLISLYSNEVFYE